MPGADERGCSAISAGQMSAPLDGVWSWTFAYQIYDSRGFPLAKKEASSRAACLPHYSPQLPLGTHEKQ